MKKNIFCYSMLMVALTLSGCNSDNVKVDENTDINYGVKAIDYLVEIADETQGIGARKASTAKEIEMGEWIYDKLTGFGYDVTVQPFTYTKKVKDVETTYESNNYIIEKKVRKIKRLYFLLIMILRA